MADHGMTELRLKGIEDCIECSVRNDDDHDDMAAALWRIRKRVCGKEPGVYIEAAKIVEDLENRT